jgi:hypothetical protein
MLHIGRPSICPTDQVKDWVPSKWVSAGLCGRWISLAESSGEALREQHGFEARQLTEIGGLL